MLGRSYTHLVSKWLPKKLMVEDPPIQLIASLETTINMNGSRIPSRPSLMLSIHFIRQAEETSDG
jgi:hypothetical protein